MASRALLPAVRVTWSINTAPPGELGKGNMGPDNTKAGDNTNPQGTHGVTYPASLVLDPTAVLLLPCPGDAGGPPGGRSKSLCFPDACAAGETPIASQCGQGGGLSATATQRHSHSVTHTGHNDHSCGSLSTSYVPPLC